MAEQQSQSFQVPSDVRGGRKVPTGQSFDAHLRLKERITDLGKRGHLSKPTVQTLHSAHDAVAETGNMVDAKWHTQWRPWLSANALGVSCVSVLLVVLLALRWFYASTRTIRALAARAAREEREREERRAMVAQDSRSEAA